MCIAVIAINFIAIASEYVFGVLNLIDLFFAVILCRKWSSTRRLRPHGGVSVLD
jgi:hypothetical protein